MNDSMIKNDILFICIKYEIYSIYIKYKLYFVLFEITLNLKWKK